VKGLGIDPGTRAVRLLEVRGKKGVYRVTRFVEWPREEGDDATASLGDALSSARIPAKGARVGVGGREVIVRYLQVPPMPEWQLRSLLKLEVESMTSQPGEGLAADYNLLPAPTGLSGEDTVLLALARTQTLERALAAAKGSRVGIGAFTPVSIAIYNAFLRCGPEVTGTTLLAHLGSENVEVALVKGTDLLFARNLAGGGRAFTEGIASRIGVPASKAERLKVEFANVDPAAKDRYASSHEERVSHAALGACGPLLTLLQSVPMLARTQAKLSEAKFERVLLSGGGARLRGLAPYLASSLGVPVEPFDPFEAVDLSALPEEEAQALDAARLEAVPALGLALLAADSELYSLEILPESLRRRREFARKTSWLVAAGALALVVLVGDGVVTSSRASRLEGRAAGLRTRNTQRDRAHRETEEDLAAEAVVVRRARLLEERMAGGSGLLRTLSLLQRHLPEDLWVTKLAIESKADPALETGEAPKPIVVLEGRGREGVAGIEGAFRQFTQALDAEVPKLQERGGTVADRRETGTAFQFRIEMNFLPEPAPEPAR